jgi:hypothetical protein
LVAEGVQLGDSALRSPVGVACQEVVAAEVLVVGALTEQIPADRQDGVPDRDSGLTYETRLYFLMRAN